MKIAIIHSTFGKINIRDTNFVPRVGDSIELWYHPFPVVRRIIAFPSLKTLDELKIPSSVEVLVFVE